MKKIGIIGSGMVAKALAKIQVSGLLENAGWEVEDPGNVESARAIEPLCMLWCIPDLRENKWNHTFKLLRKSS